MLVSAIALGILAALVTGGDWRRLRLLRIRGVPLVIAAGALRLSAQLLALPSIVYVAALVMFAVASLLNRRIPGMPLVTVGILMNVTVILFNGGMPVDLAAAAEIGVSVRNDGLHVPLTPGTVLPLLADIWPVRPFANIYSIGDVVLACGGFIAALLIVRSR
jgi:hypothetical protein